MGTLCQRAICLEPIELWSYQRLFANSSMVVIGFATNVKTDATNSKYVVSEVEIEYVIKGNISRKTIEIRHLSPIKATVDVPVANNYVQFCTKSMTVRTELNKYHINSPSYMIFLSKGQDDMYLFTAGDTHPMQSVRQVMPVLR